MYVQNELYHHGIKGMKWGIRRSKNGEGTKKSQKGLTDKQKYILKSLAVAGGVIALSCGSAKMKSIAKTSAINTGKKLVSIVLKQAPKMAEDQAKGYVDAIKLGKAIAVNGVKLGYNLTKTGVKVAKVGAKGVVLSGKIASKALG